MRDIGGLIWVVLIIIGVISSIAQNARRARSSAVTPQGRRRAQPQTRWQPQAPPPPPAIAPQGLAAVPPTPVRAAAPAAKMPQAPVLVQPAPVHGTFHVRGMFEQRTSLIRAIVTAEVLGAPKAFQEQSIWSPRHNEPSI